MNAPALLSVEDLKVVFTRGRQRLHAVDGVSFEIFENETIGLVGESGCGKSTLGKSIVQIQKQSGGRVRLEGKDLSSLGRRELLAVRRTVQIVFQDPYGSLNPRKTVRRLIGEPLMVHGIGSKREREETVRDLAEKVGIREDYLDRYPHEFSGGQRQRIGIARALVLKPRLLVCDEPVSALDVSVQLQVLNLLKALQDELALSYLFISHDLSVVRDISDRVIVMYLGKIVEVGTRQKIWSAARHPYTRALMAAIPVPDPRAAPPMVEMHGERPSASNLPSGCRFRTRCKHAVSVCTEKEPELRSVGTDQFAACHRSEELYGE